MRSTIIRIIYKAEKQNITEFVNYMYNIQLKIASYLDVYEYRFGRNKFINIITNKDFFINYYIKSIIKLEKNIFYDTSLINESYSSETGFNENLFYGSIGDEVVFFYSNGSFKSDEENYASLIIEKFEKIDRLSSYDGVHDFILYLIDIINPITIQVTHSDISIGVYKGKEWFGWLTYFNDKTLLPEINNSIIEEMLPNGGKLLISTKEIFDPNNSEHVKKVLYLVDTFKNYDIIRN